MTVVFEPVHVLVGGIDVMLTIEAFEENGAVVASVFHLEGSISLPPKAWLRAVRHEMQNIERRAREAGCNELRMAGRDWSRVLPDYQPIPGLPNGLRKVLR